MRTIGLLGDHAADEIPASHRDLLECPPVAALTTVTPDGYPQTSVVWCDFDGECELRKGHSREPFRAVEVHGDEHDRVVVAYREHMGRRARSFFAALPDPADHYVFRVEPMVSAGGA